MQGQGNSSNSYAENFGFNQQQLEILHQFWLDINSNHDASVPNGHNSLNGANQNDNSFVALLNEINENRFGRGQRLERIHSENGQVGDRPSIVQGNIELNATYERNSNDLVLQMGAGLSLRLSKTGGPVTDGNPSAIDSSNPLLISSGIAGYVLEEDDGGQGDSSNGRRLSCKRRAPEGVSRQLLLGSSSSSAQQARNSEQTDIIAQENAIISGSLTNHANLINLGELEAGLGVGVGMGTNSTNHEIPNVEGTVVGAGIGAATVYHQSSSVVATGLLQRSSINGLGPASGMGAAAGMMHQASSRVRQAEIFQRNIRSRRNANQQDFLPVSLSTRNAMNSQSQSPSQRVRFFPHEHFLNPSRPSPVQATPTMAPFMQVSNPFQTPQLSQGVNMPIAGASSSSSVLAVNRRDAQRQEGNPINNPGDIFLHPELELGELSHMATNLNLSNGNRNFPGSATVSPSWDGSNGRPSVPIWFPNPIFHEQYSNGVANIASGSESRSQNNYFPRPAGAAAARREMDNSVRGGNNARPRLRLRRSRLIPRAEREAGGHPDIHPALQSSSPRRTGRQLVSEVHNAWALMGRSGGLGFEDFMIIDHSMLLGLPEEDVHEDMRLDIEDMTYEELLALGEEIGQVCTGLNEKDILANLRLRKHQSVKDGSTVNDDPCCICQEEYADGEDLGKLDCGHDFHVNCIKQWLKQKNLCPICKKTGLASKQGEH